MNIYSAKNVLRHTTDVNTGSKRKFLLMQEDSVTLRFSLYDPVYFQLGDYLTYDKVFDITEIQKPTYNKTPGCWAYEFRFYASYWNWRNNICNSN